VRRCAPAREGAYGAAIVAPEQPGGMLEIEQFGATPHESSVLATTS
jgi:hypothetical protein